MAEKRTRPRLTAALKGSIGHVGTCQTLTYKGSSVFQGAQVASGLIALG